MADLRRLWSELMGELETRAPRTRAAILPPIADPADIGHALNLPLTEEIRTWFSLHGGVDWDLEAGQVLPGEVLLGAEDAVDATARWRQIHADDEADDAVYGPPEGGRGDVRVAGTVAGTWLPEYLAIADDTGGGGSFVDLRGGPRRGCVRAFVAELGDEFDEPVADSLTDLVQRVLDSVRTGAVLRGLVPVIADGCLDWDEPEGN